MAPRVFLLEPNDRYSLANVAEFGPVVYLNQHQCNPFNTEALVASVSLGLTNNGFRPDVDYFCLTGNTANLAIAMGQVAREYPSVQLLIFDARSGKYRARTMGSSVIDTVKEV